MVDDFVVFLPEQLIGLIQFHEHLGVVYHGGVIPVSEVFAYLSQRVCELPGYVAVYHTQFDDLPMSSVRLQRVEDAVDGRQKRSEEFLE